jgi:hypothetical protein
MDRDPIHSEIASLEYEEHKAEAAERLRFSAELAQSALRGLMIANGGAIVALFTFIGNSSANFEAEAIWRAFGFFVAGLSLTLLATGLGFAARSLYFRYAVALARNAQAEMHLLPPKEDTLFDYRWGNRAENAAIGSAALALIAFMIGCGNALHGVL